MSEHTEEEDTLAKEYRVYSYIQIKDFWMHILIKNMKNNINIHVHIALHELKALF